MTKWSQPLYAVTPKYMDRPRERERERASEWWQQYCKSLLFTLEAMGGTQYDTKQSTVGAESGGNPHLWTFHDLTFIIHCHSMYCSKTGYQHTMIVFSKRRQVAPSSSELRHSTWTNKEKFGNTHFSCHKNTNKLFSNVIVVLKLCLNYYFS